MCTDSPARNGRSTSSSPGPSAEDQLAREHVHRLVLEVVVLAGSARGPPSRAGSCPTYRSVRAQISSWPHGFSTRYGTSGISPPQRSKIERRRRRDARPHADAAADASLAPEHRVPASSMASARSPTGQASAQARQAVPWKVTQRSGTNSSARQTIARPAVGGQGERVGRAGPRAGHVGAGDAGLRSATSMYGVPAASPALGRRLRDRVRGTGARRSRRSGCRRPGRPPRAAPPAAGGSASGATRRSACSTRCSTQLADRVLRKRSRRRSEKIRACSRATPSHHARREAEDPPEARTCRSPASVVLRQPGRLTKSGKSNRVVKLVCADPVRGPEPERRRRPASGVACAVGSDEGRARHRRTRPSAHPAGRAGARGRVTSVRSSSQFSATQALRLTSADRSRAGRRRPAPGSRRRAGPAARPAERRNGLLSCSSGSGAGQVDLPLLDGRVAAGAHSAEEPRTASCQLLAERAGAPWPRGCSGRRTGRDRCAGRGARGPRRL